MVRKRIHKGLLDVLAPLVSLIIGLAFLWGWKQRRRQFEQEWARLNKRSKDMDENGVKERKS